MTVVELEEKGAVKLRTVPLIPMRELKEICGTYMELTAKSYYDHLDRNAYYHITLTDEEDIPDAIGKLRVVYPNLMKLDYDNIRTRSGGQVEALEAVQQRSPLDLFMDLYETQNGQAMSEEQQVLCRTLIEKIWEDTPCDR